ncbi:hypothetical protein [Chelativorans sp. Marseille-P2723]|uniref:hypothetical protein n=1 Tax=Chelativorans sp. Marseille-P2723 TaxID=2709133 RepID=UPI0015700141|nr:hypothetical protein [Chelativorans sp. Marseille-P2723]
MHIIDTVVAREGENSVWANVVFLDDNGQTVSVRLAYPMPTGGAAGRAHIIKRAAETLRSLVESDSFATLGEPPWAVPKGRFGTAVETEPVSRESQ